MQPTQNLHVKEIVRLLPPRALRSEFPMTEPANRTVIEGREAVKRILSREDARLLVIVGPCSIHDVDGALDYAQRLTRLREELADRLCIVMRAYFEKPRTTIGWKGLVNDPHLDGSYDIENGLKKARRLLLEITGMGLPTATEFLDPIVPQYIADFVSMPVGFKNATDGSLQIAIDAMTSARAPHSFLGIDQDGVTSIIRTTGNPHGHVVLRGGRLQANYDPESIAAAVGSLKKAGLSSVLMVDCSHANSGKQHARQEEVWKSVIHQRGSGNTALIGLMVESYLEEGNQPIPKQPADLRHGISITDACVGWETTERMLRHGHEVMGKSEKTAGALQS
ncbi:MAG: 3-deoxy-7-phosphoheptulonate synthase [Verrucomicrobia bacterium]|nr:MAG: 3-deoxy-7-phosphoheptulonate synthase [Verrucomicrobiota bacterium]